MPDASQKDTCSPIPEEPEYPYQDPDKGSGGISSCESPQVREMHLQEALKAFQKMHLQEALKAFQIAAEHDGPPLTDEQIIAALDNAGKAVQGRPYERLAAEMSANEIRAKEEEEGFVLLAMYGPKRTMDVLEQAIVDADAQELPVCVITKDIFQDDAMVSPAKAKEMGIKVGMAISRSR